MLKFIKQTSLAIVGTAALALIPGLSDSPAHADYIRSAKNMSKCFAVKSGNNGAPIVIEDCQTGFAQSQQWTYNATSGLISSVGYPGKCIHKASGGWANGNRVHLWDCAAGTPEMKTWRMNFGTGIIAGRENEGACIHKDHADLDDGVGAVLWNLCVPGVQNASWRLTRFNPDVCSYFDTVFAPNTDLVKDMLDTQMPMTIPATSRKTIILSNTGSVSSTGCDLEIVMNGLMKRKVRRTAYGSFTMRAKLHSMSASYLCMRDMELYDADLSRTGALGEWIYEVVGSKHFPDEMCTAF